MTKYVFDRAENRVGKGNNAGYHNVFGSHKDIPNHLKHTRSIAYKISFTSVKFVCCLVVSDNTFPNKPWFLRVCSTSLLKTLWEKEKLLVTSNFSFSHRVFYRNGDISASGIKFEIFVCKTLSKKSLKIVAWERIKTGTKRQFWTYPI